MLLCDFGLRFASGTGLEDFFGGKTFAVGILLNYIGRVNSSVEHRGPCSSRVDMGKDLGIGIAVKLTLDRMNVSVYIHGLGSLHISDINTSPEFHVA